MGRRENATNEMLQESILVAAHPDDEVLWYSSILKEVDEVILCFLGSRDNPKWTAGRQESITAHPISNMSSLGLDEPGAFNAGDWHNPVVTEFGLELSRKKSLETIYRKSYEALRQRLEKRLVGFRNVFTHNPWGEYGHEEHIQVYKAIRELQRDMQFNLWFSNYCSNKSYPLMLKYVSGFDSAYVTRKTDKILGGRLKDLYQRNGCWTWYDDYEWFNDESFMKDKGHQESQVAYGHIFPVNFIKIGVPGEFERKPKGRHSWLIRVLKKNK